MHPTLSGQIFDWQFTASAYVVFFYLAVLVFFSGSYFLAVFYFKLPKVKVLGLLLILIISGLLGARLLNFILNAGFYLENPSRFWSLKLQGFSIFGIALAVPFGWWYCRKAGLDSWRTADALAPFIGLSVALMRVGCFLNGCCYGKETDWPWGVVFPNLSRTHLHQISQNPLALMGGAHPVHPTQIYELIAALLGSVIASWLIRKKAPAGTAFLAFALWFSLFRFFNNFLRVPPSTFDASSFFYPFFYLFFILISFYFLFLKIGKGKAK